MPSGPKPWVRQAHVGDEPILRDLRLQALSDSPSAFGSTYERELARTTSDWRKWLSPSATFLLESADGAQGLVCAVPDETDAAVVHLMAMWVSPRVRGLGAGDDLVAAVIAWAASKGAHVVRLEVMKANAHARHCYERNGFRPVGQEATREGDGRVQIRMERAIVATELPGSLLA